MANFKLEDLTRDAVRRWLTDFKDNLGYVVLSNRSDKHNEVALGRWDVVDMPEAGEADPFDTDGDAEQEVVQAPAGADTDMLVERLWEWINDHVTGELIDSATERFRLKFYGIKGSRLLASPSFSAIALIQPGQTSTDLYSADNPAIIDPMRSAMALLMDGCQRLLNMSAQGQDQVLSSAKQVTDMFAHIMRGMQGRIDQVLTNQDMLIEALTGAKLERLDAPNDGKKGVRSQRDAQADVAMAALDQVGKGLELLALGKLVSPEQRELLTKLSSHPKLGPLLNSKGLGKLLENEDAVNMIASQFEFMAKQAEAADQPQTDDHVPDEAPPSFTS